MIPTKTLRERMTEALEVYVDPEVGDVSAMVQDAINAIGDPCLIETADSKEPTFTLRAQDKAAAEALECWIEYAAEQGCPEEKIEEAEKCFCAFLAWKPRKWPD